MALEGGDLIKPGDSSRHMQALCSWLEQKTAPGMIAGYRDQQRHLYVEAPAVRT
jgi:hypothetical protein